MVVKYEVDNSACEIGYSIGSAYWNKGYSTEALQAVIDFLFAELGLNRISAKHDILNPASGEVMKKCKMSHEGILRDVQFKNNRFCTLAVIGRGIGSKLIQEAEKIAASHSQSEIRLWVLENNHSSRKFYEKNGYAATGQVKRLEKFGQNEVRYVKKIL